MAAIPQLLVYKFGGASVKDAAAILNLKHIVETTAAGQPLLVVVSAMSKTTNVLEEIFDLAYNGQPYSTQLDILLDFHWAVAHELFGEKQKTLDWDNEDLALTINDLREGLEYVKLDDTRSYDEQYDQIISYGEILSSLLVYDALRLLGPNTEARSWYWLDARELICTDTTWREAQVDWQKTQTNLAGLQLFSSTAIAVTQGFIGGPKHHSEATTITPENYRVTTLGREGSDYSAAIFAYCLGAESVTIWKDVAGLLSADPKIFPDAVRYPEISYQETIEMAYYGASVIHPKTLKPLAERGIPLRVRSFLDPGAPGTLIHDCQHPALAPAFIRKTGQCLLSFESKDFAFISEENLEVIFGALAQTRLKINLMQNSAISFSVCTDFSERRTQQLLGLLAGQFRVHYNADLTLFTIKNYDAASVARLTAGRELLLEQRTRSTFQFVCR